MPQPKILVVCPDFSHPCGGVRMLYRHVDALQRSGFAASIVHRQPGFRVTWFANSTPVQYFPLSMRDEDILVLPELEARCVEHAPRHIRKVILNQNAYFTFKGYPTDGTTLATPYLRDDVIGTIVVSLDSFAYMRYAFPRLPCFRVRVGIDQQLFQPRFPKKRQVSFMPRKHHEDAEQVLSMLRYHGVLDGFQIARIDQVSLSEVAAIMSESAVFLSFGYPEGCPLPPMEAIASGCITIGYHGRGGSEYFLPEFSFPIDDGNVIRFAQTTERVLRDYDGNIARFEEMGRVGAAFVHSTYSLDAERESIAACWQSILDSRSPSPVRKI